MLSAPQRSTVAILASSLLLASCASQPFELDGQRAVINNGTLQIISDSWIAHVEKSGIANTTDPNSRCYIQRSGDVVLDSLAVCGPIHYAGNDKTTWDSIRLARRSGSVRPVGTSFASVASAALDGELFRPDGLQADTSLELSEPQADYAAVLTPIISDDMHVAGPPIPIKTPTEVTTVTAHRETPLVGGAFDRLQAPVSHVFTSFTVDFDPGRTSPDDVVTELSLIHHGKSYPLGKAKSGTYSMAVPRGEEVELGIAYDGVLQLVSSGSGGVENAPSALFDGLERTAVLEDSVLVSEKGGPKTVAIRDLKAESFAHSADLGWATEGHKWMVLSAVINPEADGFRRPTTNIDSLSLKLESGTTIKPVKMSFDGGRLYSVFAIPSGDEGRAVDVSINATIESLLGDWKMSSKVIHADFSHRTVQGVP